jgi:hypothetical protein
MGFEQSPQFVVAHFPYKRGYFLKPVGHGSKIGDWGEGSYVIKRLFDGNIQPLTKKVKTQGHLLKSQATPATLKPLAINATGFSLFGVKIRVS